MKKKLNLPKFQNEAEEREFWAKIDLNDYVDESDFTDALFPNLKPSSRSISVRMPEHILARVKEKANELNIPYQTLIKQFVARGLLQK